MRILKFILSVFLVLLVFLGVFFFWAKAPNLSKDNYQKVIVKNYQNTQRNDSVFKIITYNIGYLSGMTNNLPQERFKDLYDKNLQLAKTELKNSNADFITFQEIDFDASRSYFVNQQNEIAKIGYNYIAEAVNWDKTYLPFPYWPIKAQFGKVVSGQSILSKFPIENHEVINLERVKNEPFHRKYFYIDRLAQVVIVNINGKEVALINIHLEAYDEPTRKIQFDQVLSLFNKYKKNYPTILLGDFNSEGNNKSSIINVLFKMKNIGNAAFNSDNIANTFNSINPLNRLDYIFYTENSIEYISGEVLNQFGEISDHLPVEMRFKLK